MKSRTEAKETSFLRGWVGLRSITIEDLGGGGISLEECIIELEKRIRAIKLVP